MERLHNGDHSALSSKEISHLVVRVCIEQDTTALRTLVESGIDPNHLLDYVELDDFANYERSSASSERGGKKIG